MAKDFVRRIGDPNSALRAGVGEGLDHPFITRKNLIDYQPYQIAHVTLKRTSQLLVYE
jgi:hypothetical protein